MTVAKTRKAANKANGKPKHPQSLPKVKENEAQIAVHWKEEENFHPSPQFIGQANLNDPAIVERFSEKNFPECFPDNAELLDWDQYWHTTLETSNPPFWKWFVGVKLNTSSNSLSRPL